MTNHILLFLLLISTIPSFAGPGNIAPLATVTASTETPSAVAKNVADGIIGVDGMGEWACVADTAFWGYIRLPWIQLEWDSAQWINKVVLFDRASLKQNSMGVKIRFSDGSVEWLNRLPADGTGMAFSFAPRQVKWMRLEVFDGMGGALGFSEIEVYPWVEHAADYVSLVDPYIETNKGRYFFFITGSLPFGMATSAPMTRNKNQCGGGYNYNEPEILGFEQIHSWMLSGIEIMPATTAQIPRGQQSWKSSFNHDDEIVQPGYHRVMLQKNKIWVEQTATERVNFYRFRYTQNNQARLIINLGGKVSNCTMVDASVSKVSDTEIEGSFGTIKRLWGGPTDVRVFFVIRFDKPFAHLQAWKGNKAMQEVADKVSGDSLTLGADYKMQAGELLQMKIAISYTTIENARKNMEAECAHWSFDQVRNSAKDIWNQWLGKIEVKGGSTAQRIKFYTDLWHALLGRQKINDVSGDYPDRTQPKKFVKTTVQVWDFLFTDAQFKIKTIPKDASGKPKFNMYNSDALWLTQWNLNVLWGLAWPQVLDDFSASMLEYANNGYKLPRGPCGGGYTYIMTGDPAANLITSTFQKGLLKKVDTKHAYEVVKRNQLPGGMLGDSSSIKFYTQKGWWPDNAGITVEAAFQDWGVAQMAAKLGFQKDAKFFAKRSGGWVNCFDPNQKLLFPKDRNGKFITSDPLSGNGWVESNAWQGTWGLSHDISRLVKLMGEDTFSEKLNHAFEQAKDQDFVYGYGEGYVSYANQPGCSNAHVFSYGKKPWLTQYWVRRVKEQAFGGITPDLGYGGQDEDQGQMGGVSALMAIGLFDIMGNQAQQPVYEITSPVFDEIVIHLNKDYYTGNNFIIRCHDNSAANDYIQSAKLNGKEQKTFWFTHETLAKGGELELWLGPKPNMNWGVAGLPPACSIDKK